MICPVHHRRVQHNTVKVHYGPFPSAVKIGIESAHQMWKFDEWQVKRVIRVIIESKGDTIEELAINDYHEDYLGQILNEMNQGPAIILKNVDLTASVIQDIKKIFGVAGAESDLLDRVTFSKDGIPEHVITLKKLESYQPVEMTCLKKLKLTHSISFDSPPTKVLEFDTKHAEVENLSRLRNSSFEFVGKYCPNLRELQISSLMSPQKAIKPLGRRRGK